MESIQETKSPFTLVVDWLAFTVPNSFVEEIKAIIGGEWTQVEFGFRGYPISWIANDGADGVGKLGTGAPRRPKEVHVDLSAGIVAGWPVEKIKGVLRWIIDDQTGHVTRLDCALDDREPLVPVSLVKGAYKAGKAVTRARRFKSVSAEDADSGDSLGETLYFGSPTSQTMLRVYDKRLELQQKGRTDWAEYGTRWELELKKDQAHVLALHFAHLEEDDWLQLVISRLRAYIDFRETSRDAENWARCRASLLDWWEQLTEGFRKGRFAIQKSERRIEDVKDWFSRAMGPTLAVLYTAPGAGQDWIEKVIQAGADRWKDKHLRLLKGNKPRTEYFLKPNSLPD